MILSINIFYQVPQINFGIFIMLYYNRLQENLFTLVKPPHFIVSQRVNGIYIRAEELIL